MKEYSLQEIFDLPEGIEYINADAHFEVKNGVLYNWFKPNDKQSVRLTKMYVNMKFIKAENPVSFQEAVNAGLEGKMIKVKHYSLNDSWHDIYFGINKIFEMLSKATTKGIPSIIQEGEWYIEENDEC